MNFAETVTYILGREIRTIRILYWRLSRGRYLWGIYLFMYDRNSRWMSH